MYSVLITAICCTLDPHLLLASIHAQVHCRLCEFLVDSSSPFFLRQRFFGVAACNPNPTTLVLLLPIMSSSSYSEKHGVLDPARLEAQETIDSSQPGMPTMYHRRLANPAPLGLLAFATTSFLVSITGMGTRGVETPNIIITTLIFFGGVCQYIACIMEFCSGNTVRSTLRTLQSLLTMNSLVRFYSFRRLRWVQCSLRSYLYP